LFKKVPVKELDFGISGEGFGVSGGVDFVPELAV
jgi:hypothetical protein